MARWSVDVTRAVVRLEDLIERGDASPATARAVRTDLRAARAVVRRCLVSFEDSVGPAPTEKLHALADDIEATCAGLRRAANLALRAVSSPQARRRMQDELARSLEIAEATDRKLDDYRPEEDVDVPTLEGKAEHVSRSEPTFSDVGQLLVGKPVEIRCWAPSDWRSLTGQVEAYTGRPLPATETGGFVLVPGRANLSPRVCAPARRSDVRPVRGAALPQDVSAEPAAQQARARTCGRDARSRGRACRRRGERSQGRVPGAAADRAGGEGPRCRAAVRGGSRNPLPDANSRDASTDVPLARVPGRGHARPETRQHRLAVGRSTTPLWDGPMPSGSRRPARGSSRRARPRCASRSPRRRRPARPAASARSRAARRARP